MFDIKEDLLKHMKKAGAKQLAILTPAPDGPGYRVQLYSKTLVVASNHTKWDKAMKYLDREAPGCFKLVGGWE